MLELKHIHKTFGAKTVADDISLTVADGSLTAILGPSGCGKSTLLNIAAGLVPPDSGEVWIGGENRTDTAAEKRQVALMFQDYALLPHLNVWQNVAFGLKMRGTGAAEARRRAETALAAVGLAAESGRRVDALSGGEQQRVALARALVVQPQLLLLDEPFSSLDTGLRQQLRGQTLAQVRAQNIPAVLVTHDPEEAFALADHLMLMQGGRMVQYGAPDALLQRPADAWAARLMGAINVEDARYIPQQALQFAHPQGQASRVVQSLALPDACRLRVLHPQHGEITLNLGWNEAAGRDIGAGSIWPVRVDEAQIVYF
ncbi:ABC transporter ATP-binding protein [Uruburuella testudinis]|uniref:ABC transporter ATP-binding protein n=1 Tax=Uruburuella testudinis TaxID=1282863 RepID=A0ABY4DSG6_9NEIS|nr:ABC transporter ATP-binding protein [Uruburuella testudinis]UOO81978.1 ABC transporter ATP-binding protein [Uruburuella testudinis]